MKALIVSGEGVDNPDFLVPYYKLKEEGIDVDIAYLKKGKVRRKRAGRAAGAKNRSSVRTAEYDVLFVSVGSGKELIAL
ncbi:MAG TPA: DJ-1/PfpI family protein [Dissulfurispiraceae bacterium]|nr:DJ-1/PfpI family protein [Dissulfurispiraceae bacterium]